MNILLIDGGKAFAHSAGRLNHTLHQVARDTLSALGHHVRETVIDDGYDIHQEVEKFQWMDAVIWQMPGWWMHEPWTVKNIWTRCLPPARVPCTLMMVATGSAPLKDTARAVFFRVVGICCR